MPAAVTHDRIALVAAGVMVAPSYAILHYGLGDAPEAAYTGALLVTGAHLFGSWLLSPDLDLDSKIDDRWGPLRMIWIPYMRLVPHRHFLSHSGISGLFRLAYLYGAIVLILAAVSFGAYLLNIDVRYHQIFTDWLWSTFRSGSRPAFLLVAGVVISDLIHVIADRLDTGRKRFMRPRRRR